MLPSYKPRLIFKIIFQSLSIFSVVALLIPSGFNHEQVINDAQMSNASAPISSLNQTQNHPSEVREVIFKLISPSIGWVLENERLYGTNDNGSHWTDITPSFRGADEKIEAVFFKTEKLGWMVSSQPELTQNRFTIFTTKDGGKSWKEIPFANSNFQEHSLQFQHIAMQWIDAQTGWMMFKQPTGVNFSVGIMFHTSDGGQTWEKLKAPSGESFIFFNDTIGFIEAGPGNPALFKTDDAGFSWQKVEPNLVGEQENVLSKSFLPSFLSSGYGIVPVVQSGKVNQVNILESFDWGLHWSKRDEFPLNHEIDPAGSVSLKLYDPENYAFWLNNSSTIMGVQDGESFTRSIAGPDQNPLQLSLESMPFIWGEFVQGNCKKLNEGEHTEKFECLSTKIYASSEDGGSSWKNLILPSGGYKFEYTFSTENEVIADLESISPLDNTQVFIGQGFDRCEIPTLAQMQTWYSNSPYRVVNLYIGGVSRACSNNALSENYVSQLQVQGWKFIPTWVGPQAPCSGFNHKMSSDPAIAYQEGVTNANQAVATLANLGLTYDNASGSVVYYDIEAYSGTQTCYSAVTAFMNGWTDTLSSLNNTSGIYGSSCGSHLSNFLSHPPDVIWPAAWYHNSGSGYYNPSATVWGLPCLSDSVFVNHQRIRQYEGGHFENWGGVSLEIDCNVLDGVVAVRTDAIPPVSSISLSGTIGENGYYRSHVIATISATDDNSGVAYSQYNLNGSGWVNYASPFTITSNGINTIQYRSLDLSGNWETAKAITFGIDTLPPSNPTAVEPGCLAASNTWQNVCNDANFFWSGASDATSGLARYQYYWGTNPSGSAGPETPYSVYDPPPVTDGTYYLRIRTKDNAGNWSSWITLFTLQYDGTAPIGSILLQQGWAEVQKTIINYATIASDQASGLANYRIRTEGYEWSEWLPYAVTGLWILPPYTGNQYRVEVQFEDYVGNTSEIEGGNIYLNIYPQRPQSNHYRLQKWTLGKGTTNASSENYQLMGTLAQASAIGSLTSENYMVDAGYWSRLRDILMFNKIYLPIIYR